MTLFIVSLILFLLTHSVRIVAPDWRDAMIERMGQQAWRGLYSVLSLATLVFLIYAFGASRTDAPLLYSPPAWMAHITLTLMLIAMILLMVSIFPAGKIAVWVKHPLLTAVKIWAFSHLLANGEANSVLLFAGFLIWAVVARISAKRQGIDARAFVSVKWDIAAVITGVVVYVAFVGFLHEYLIGVSPLAMAGM